MSSVLTEAENIVNGAREGQYGKAEDSFERIARLWNAYLINKGLVAEGGLLLNGNDTANLMILLKLAREQHAHKRDNYVDMAGYAELANRTAEAGKQPAPSVPSVQHSPDCASLNTILPVNPPRPAPCNCGASS